MKKILILSVLAILMSACNSSNHLWKLEKRIKELEKTDQEHQVTLNYLTDKVFDGQSEIINGKAFYPKANKHETDDYILYYRKKDGDTYYDIVMEFKKDLYLIRKGAFLGAKSITFTENGVNIIGGNMKFEDTEVSGENIQQQRFSR